MVPSDGGKATPALFQAVPRGDCGARERAADPFWTDQFFRSRAAVGGCMGIGHELLEQICGRYRRVRRARSAPGNVPRRVVRAVGVPAAVTRYRRARVRGVAIRLDGRTGWCSTGSRGSGTGSGAHAYGRSAIRRGTKLSMKPVPGADGEVARARRKACWSGTSSGLDIAAAVQAAPGIRARQRPSRPWPSRWKLILQWLSLFAGKRLHDARQERLLRRAAIVNPNGAVGQLIPVVPPGRRWS